VEDESIVNLPNLFALTLRIEGGEWFDLSSVELLGYRQELDLRRAVLIRVLRLRDAEGRETAMTERRPVSMANPYVAALQTTLAPVNWSGLVTFRSALDGRVVNGGVERDCGPANRHLASLEAPWGRIFLEVGRGEVVNGNFDGRRATATFWRPALCARTGDASPARGRRSG